MSIVGGEQTTLEIVLPSRLGYEKLVRTMLAWLLPRLGFEQDRVADMQTAVSEACINGIEHGNACRSDLRLRITVMVSSQRIEVIVADEGVRRVQPRVPATIEQRLAGLTPARGMGLMLIDQLVDEAGFMPSDGRGNSFRLCLYRRPAAATAAS